jgi:LacI family transcriptional regulator
VTLPDDLAIASFDGSPESEFTWPTLTTVRQPIEELASRSLEQLLSESPTSEGELLRGTLVVRRSCGCVS